jgi:hypothetical protein
MVGTATGVLKLQNSYFSKSYDVNLYVCIGIVLCIEDSAQL